MILLNLEYCEIWVLWCWVWQFIDPASPYKVCHRLFQPFYFLFRLNVLFLSRKFHGTPECWFLSTSTVKVEYCKSCVLRKLSLTMYCYWAYIGRSYFIHLLILSIPLKSVPVHFSLLCIILLRLNAFFLSSAFCLFRKFHGTAESWVLRKLSTAKVEYC